MLVLTVVCVGAVLWNNMPLFLQAISNAAIHRLLNLPWTYHVVIAVLLIAGVLALLLRRTAAVWLYTAFLSLLLVLSLWFNLRNLAFRQLLVPLPDNTLQTLMYSNHALNPGEEIEYELIEFVYSHLRGKTLVTTSELKSELDAQEYRLVRWGGLVQLKVADYVEQLTEAEAAELSARSHITRDIGGQRYVLVDERLAESDEVWLLSTDDTIVIVPEHLIPDRVLPK